MKNAVKRYAIGERVYWNDPDEKKCSGLGTVTAVEYGEEGPYGDEIISIKKDDGGEVEALAQELLPMFKHVIDVSRRSPDDMIPAQLTLVSKFSVAQEALFAFRDAVNFWLQSTKTGQQAWKDSSEDFNYGDLINEQIDVDLLYILEVAGFTSILVERLDIGLDIGEDYDSRFDGEGATG